MHEECVAVAEATLAAHGLGIQEATLTLCWSHKSIPTRMCLAYLRSMQRSTTHSIIIIRSSIRPTSHDAGCCQP